MKLQLLQCCRLLCPLWHTLLVLSPALSSFHSVLMFIGLASYLLADNRLPLACTGAAKSIYTDTVLNTLNSTFCNTIHYNNTLHIIQVSLWAPAVIIAFYALFFTCGWYLCCQSCKPGCCCGCCCPECCCLETQSPSCHQNKSSQSSKAL